jgi:hypothetical protein
MKLIKDQNWFDLQVCNQGGSVFCVCDIAEKSYDKGIYISVEGINKLKNYTDQDGCVLIDLLFFGPSDVG